MQPKKKLVISMDNASKEVLEAIAKKYPDGWQYHVIKIEKGSDNFFFAVTVDLSDISYLVKVPVKIDTKIEDEIEKDDYRFLADSDDSEEEGESESEEKEISQDMENIEDK
ncbi:MAG: hypothetical protein HY958_07210 [Bacteroidia bacterium]|nr:hypothetical protein [Bacteroidia bacterium]